MTDGALAEKSSGHRGDALCPTSETEVAAIVADARASKTPLAMEGGGTRSALGRPAPGNARLVSLSSLSGITLHEPAEMIMAAKAGTPIAEIERVLAEKGQRLAFEPMDHRALYGTGGEPTIGGVAAINAAGPRRIVTGAARDSIVGLRFFNGRAELIKNGGRVMKNVTGLDLVKLSCGAFGTLGILTEVTFKVLPVPERMASLVIHGLDDASAVAAMTRAVGSPFEVTGAAHLPGETPRTVLRLEGFAESVDYRLGRLRDLLCVGDAATLDGAENDALWQGIRDCMPLAEPRDTAIWRVSLKPTDGPKLAAALGAGFAGAHLYDWGGGLLWIALPAKGNCGEAELRAALRRFGGHARLERAPEPIRASVPVFEPEAAPIARLSAGIRASFDPDHLLNPGRMTAEI